MARRAAYCYWLSTAKWLVLTVWPVTIVLAEHNF